jgi:hypothetical protein
MGWCASRGTCNNRQQTGLREHAVVLKRLHAYSIRRMYRAFTKKYALWLAAASSGAFPKLINRSEISSKKFFPFAPPGYPVAFVASSEIALCAFTVSPVRVEIAYTIGIATAVAPATRITCRLHRVKKGSMLADSDIEIVDIAKKCAGEKRSEGMATHDELNVLLLRPICCFFLLCT